MLLGKNPALFLAAAWVFLSGCGSSETTDGPPPAGTPPARDGSAAPAAGRLDTSGASELPGPPGSTSAPTSTDPAVRTIEDRLFRTDGGRVVLKGIRAHGGWKLWLEVKEIRATIKEIPPKDPEKPEAPAGAPSVVVFRPADPAAVPATEDERILAAPFWFASPALSLEYMGVEISSLTGETYDKVRVFQTKPGTEWRIAYFNRHTGILERTLKPAPTREDPRVFSRIDLREPREVEGFWFPTLWNTFTLENRFARPDLSRPDRSREVQIDVAQKQPGPGASPASN